MSILLIASVLAACKKSPQSDWREEVTSVMDAIETTEKTKVPDASSQTPSKTDSPTPPNIPDGYVVNTPHPLKNPDAGTIPSISYGRNYMIYQDYLYYPALHYGPHAPILSYSKLSDLVTADLTVKSGVNATQKVPNFQPVCNNPFCMHKSYNINDGAYCQLYFGVHRGDINDPTVGENWSQTYYCLDYGESKGELPVFYICAAEPEYTVIGEQVIETESRDAAIYRYDSSTGKRTMLVDNLSDSIYFFAQSGDYLYYASPDGLTVLNKTGKQIGRIESEGRLYHILDVVDDTLYICDELGDLYTADRELNRVEQKFSYTFDLSELDPLFHASVLGDTAYVPPYGYTISDGYLYYCADFKVEYEDERSSKYSSSIYRIPLSALNSSPEHLADGVRADCIYGVNSGKVYYNPYTYDPETKKYYNHMSNVEIDTKKVHSVIIEGYDTLNPIDEIASMPIINRRFIIGRSNYLHQGAILVYDLETGDYMYMCDDFMFLS